MGILSGQNKVLNDGDNASSLIDNVMNCARILNECSSLKEHNTACKLLVNTIGKKSLDIHDEALFNINLYDIVGNSTSGSLKSSTKPVLVYSPPRGCRAAIIHIFNAVKDFDNVKIESPGFCCELSDRYFDVYPGTVAFDITDENLATDLLSKHLKVFQW
jgi:hypothetical protein